MTSKLASNQNQWQQNLTNVAQTVQNGNKNTYKKYDPNANNNQQQQKMAQQYSAQQPLTQQQKSLMQQTIMSDPIAPTPNTGNSNWGGLSNTIKTQTQPVSNNQTINNMANANQIPTGLRVNVSASNSASNTGNNEPSSDEKMSLPEFVNWGGEGNNTAYFNPTMAATSIPNYTKKEGSYGTYEDDVVKQRGYAQEIGSLGGKTDANGNYIDLFEQIARGVDGPAGPSSNVTNAYVNLDDTLEQMAGSSDIEAAPDSGYKERDLKEGYTVDDLNLMAQNGFNTLGDAYQNALNKAAANYNRLGLRGSGFELADEFGNQTDSITSNYLKNVQQLQNDIATKGLEAEREDRYKNAEANDKNRYDWADYYTKLAEQNYKNKGELAELQQKFGDSQNTNELEGEKLRIDNEHKNINNAGSAIKTYAETAGQSHNQQMDRDKLDGGLAQLDMDYIMRIWEDMLKNDQFTAEQKNDIIKTMLASLATGTAGSNENYNAMIGQFGDYSDYIKDMMKAADYPVQR